MEENQSICKVMVCEVPWFECAPVCELLLYLLRSESTFSTLHERIILVCNLDFRRDRVFDIWGKNRIFTFLANLLKLSVNRLTAQRNRKVTGPSTPLTNLTPVEVIQCRIRNHS